MSKLTNDKVEKDLLASLEADPEQAYVINYLAYLDWTRRKNRKIIEYVAKSNR